MVELRTRKRARRGDGGNHHEQLRLQRILCASQFTIAITAGRSPNPAWHNINMRSSQPTLASCTPDYSCPLISSELFSSSYPILLFLVNYLTIIAEYKVKSSISVSPGRDHELTPSTSIHQVQNTPSTAYTESTAYTVSTAYTKYSIHPRLFVFLSFSWLGVDLWMYFQLWAYLRIRLNAISQLLMSASR